MTTPYLDDTRIAILNGIVSQSGDQRVAYYTQLQFIRSCSRGASIVRLWRLVW